jgi:hypothetical protein
MEPTDGPPPDPNASPQPAPDAAAEEPVAASGESAPAPSAQPDEPALPEPRTRVLVDVAAGDLVIRGGAPQVQLHLRDDRSQDGLAEDSGGVLRFDWLPGRSELRVPDGAEIEVRRIEGDLEGRALDGVLLVHHVAGDANLYDMAAVEVMQVDGELTAQHGGALRARRVAGDVQLRDLARAPLLGHIGGDLVASEMPGLELRASCGGDVSLERCGDVSLLGTIGGDLRAEGSVVSVSASSVGGDVRITSVRSATLAAVGGDFQVAGMDGPIEVSSVGGDVRIRGSAGRIRLGTIGGDLEATNVTGGIAIGRAGGDVTLDTALAPGVEYLIQASSDITLRVRGEVNARFVAQTVNGEIRTRLPLTVEKGRRRNLVGVLGRGDATVTLRTIGGDISIAATDRIEEEHDMGDDFVGRDEDRERDEKGERVWEGAVGGRRFRMRWDRGPGRAGFHFQGPFTPDNDPDGKGPGTRDFKLEWEKGQGARMSGEYEERLNELRDRAERVARRATEEAQRYAEKAAKRARETDWEAVGREVRTAIEKAMGDLEETFTQFRRDWETRRPAGSSSSSAGSRPGGAQRVKIEYDDDPDAAGAASAAPENRDDRDAQRRTILEQLRSGELTLDEAERRLSDLR